MDLPIIDLDLFLSESRDSDAVIQECKKVIVSLFLQLDWSLIALQAADALIVYGALLLSDSRVSESDNVTFLDLLEDYFAQPQDVLQQDERPELGYQVGATLENTEKPKCAVDEPCLNIIAQLEPSERPLDISGHHPDPKCRFFWRMSEAPPYPTAYPALNAQNVVPKDETIKARWTPVMEKWGLSMKQA